jgi:parvulin-like peptidyl-prolyl isomerase
MTPQPTPLTRRLARPPAALYRTALVVLLLAPLAIASCGEVPDASRVVAQVNGKDITYGDMIREAERLHGPQVLVGLLDQSVIQGEAQKRGLALTPQEQKAGLDRAAARVGSMRDLEAQLKRAGIPLAAYQQRVDTDLLLDKITYQEAKVSDQEIEAYYQAHHKDFARGPRARARLMLFSDRGSAEAVQQALAAPEADFAGLAKSLSEDGATAPQGGDTGFFEERDYAPVISKAAFELPVGATSDLLQAPDGWVILRVEERKPAGVLPLDEVKEQIRQLLLREKQDALRGDWLVSARKAAQISIRDKEMEEAVKGQLDQTPMPPMPGQL